MRYRDYHLHSEFSFDSTEKIENICEKAVREGIEEIVFTDHVEFCTEDAKDVPDFDRREEILAQCRKRYGNRLSIRSGVEMGQPQRDPEKEKRIFDAYHFDFVIESIHIVGDTGRPSRFEFTEENYHAYFAQYFKELRELAEKCRFDVVGHVTFPFRYVPQDLLRKYPIEDFKDEFISVFKAIVERGKKIEINTSGLRTALKAPMPDQKIVRWYKECGGEYVTIGSDGHSVRSAFSGLDIGYKLAESEDIMIWSI